MGSRITIDMLPHGIIVGACGRFGHPSGDANGARKLAEFEAILVDVEKRVLANLSEDQRSTLHDLLRIALADTQPPN